MGKPIVDRKKKPIQVLTLVSFHLLYRLLSGCWMCVPRLAIVWNMIVNDANYNLINRTRTKFTNHRQAAGSQAVE